jgi:hypothetical protein
MRIFWSLCYVCVLISLSAGLFSVVVICAVPLAFFLRPKFGFNFVIALFLLLHVDVGVIYSQAHILIH